MENQTVQNEEKVVKKKVVKKFSRPTAFGLIFLTVIFCGALAIYFNNHFLTYRAESRYVAQIAHDKKQVEKKPNDPAARVQLGFSYYRNGDNEDAIDQYKTALKLKKDYFPAILNIATVYDALKDNNKALDYASKAVKLSPKDERALLLKGRAYKNLKLYSKASIALEEANKVSPGNSDIIYEIGNLAELQGDKKAALSIYKDALKYNPLYKPALQGVSRLKNK